MAKQIFEFLLSNATIQNHKSHQRGEGEFENESTEQEVPTLLQAPAFNKNYCFSVS